LSATPEEEKAAARRLNRAAFENAIYAPLGVFLQQQAWRKNVAGIQQGPLPFFWGVSKTV
jgi:peptide/nickel transport system substrate-binding protein